MSEDIRRTVKDIEMGYPRVCAHRGFHSVIPENSLPAYGAAVALSAPEIEFDLWWTKDDQVVSIHDATLDRISDGHGHVYDYTLEELRKFDFGSKKGPSFAGLRIPMFEEILCEFARRTVMNIHIKSLDNVNPIQDESHLERVVALIRKYDCAEYVYFMSGNDEVLRQLKRIAPDIRRCTGAGNAHFQIVDRAISLGCDKVQLWEPDFDQAMIDKAHAHGIKCNCFYADDPKRALEMIEMGVDTILTNQYQIVSEAVKKYVNEKGITESPLYDSTK